MRLHDLKPRHGATHRRKRLGAGESSGRGKTSGKGHKGQKARAGGSIRPGFEGGQMPLLRRLPKRGFNNADHTIDYCPVNVGALEKVEAEGVIDESTLRKAGLVNGRWNGVKILGTGELTKKLSLRVDKISAGARTKVEAAGGSIELIEPKPKPERNSAKVKRQAAIKEKEARRKATAAKK